MSNQYTRQHLYPKCTHCGAVIWPDKEARRKASQRRYYLKNRQRILADKASRKAGAGPVYGQRTLVTRQILRSLGRD